MAFEKGEVGDQLLAQSASTARQGLSSEYIQSMIGKPPTTYKPYLVERQNGEPEDPQGRADFWMKRLDIRTGGPGDSEISRKELWEAARSSDDATRKLADYLSQNFDRVTEMYDDWGFDELISKKDLQEVFKVEKFLSGVESKLQKTEPTLTDGERKFAVNMVSAAFHADLKQFARGVVSLDGDPSKAKRIFKAVAGQLSSDSLKVHFTDSNIRFSWVDGWLDKVPQWLSFDTGGVTDRGVENGRYASNGSLQNLMNRMSKQAVSMITTK